MVNERKIGLQMVLLGMAAALAMAGPPKYDIEITVKDKRIEKLGPQGLSLVFYLDLANSSSSPYFLVKYDYQVLIERAEYIRLETVLDEPIRIEPDGNTLVSLPLKITYALLFQALPDLEDKDKLVCYLLGGITFQNEKGREKRIPITFSGQFPVFKDFKIKIENLEAKSFSIGGAELDFKVTFENGNGFDLKLEKLNYKLELGGKAIDRGEITGGRRMGSQAKHTFSFPLLLDFFEIDRSVYKSLEESQILVRFSGEVEVDTEWGNFVIPFDRIEKVSVVKISG